MSMHVPIERRGAAAVYEQTRAINIGLRNAFEALRRGDRKIAAGEYLAVSNAYRARGSNLEGERRIGDMDMATRYGKVSIILIGDNTVDPKNIAEIYPEGVGVHNLPELLEKADRAW